MEKQRLIRKFDKQSKIYEYRRKRLTEREWRRKLVGDARGKTLEVAVGAGANFPFYPSGVRVTAVDFSGAMLDKARRAAAEHGVAAEFVQADLETLDFPDGSFDTILSTLSFCGYERPERMLEKFDRWCKPGGRILMMEHGLSASRLVGAAQRALEPLFHRVVGCHFDRDMVALLRNSPLHVVRMERHLLGAFHLVWAEPHGQPEGEEFQQ